MAAFWTPIRWWRATPAIDTSTPSRMSSFPEREVRPERHGGGVDERRDQRQHRQVQCASGSRSSSRRHDLLPTHALAEGVEGAGTDRRAGAVVWIRTTITTAASHRQVGRRSAGCTNRPPKPIARIRIDPNDGRRRSQLHDVIWNFGGPRAPQSPKAWRHLRLGTPRKGRCLRSAAADADASRRTTLGIPRDAERSI